MSVVKIDGSFGEGGGQLLRYAISFASITGRAVEVYNIRAKRRPSGLRPQHLLAVRLAAALTAAQVEGLAVGSERVLFRPSSIRSGSFEADVGTAGSISLVLQTLVPIAAFAPSEIKLRLSGGTDVKWSPTMDYMRFVFAPVLRLFGLGVDIQIVRRGYYPRGGGVVECRVRPAELKGLRLRRGEVRRVLVRSVCSNLRPDIAERQAKSAVSVLKREFDNVETIIEVLGPREAAGRGTSVLALVEFDNGIVMGGDSIGEIGKPAEVVGREAAESLLSAYKSGAVVDKHLGDMLVPFAVFAEGTTEYTTSEVTLHLVTALHISNLVAGARYDLVGDIGTVGLVRIFGAACPKRSRA